MNISHAAAQINLDERRREISASLDPKQRSALGQFLTPSATAAFMAGLLDFSSGDVVRLLDPGAGIGALTAAAIRRAQSEFHGRLNAQQQQIHLTCCEIEPAFSAALEETLRGLGASTFEVLQRDFIEVAVRAAMLRERPYTHAILNPPYKKIQVGSSHRLLIRKLGLETTNLYACFVAAAVALCAPGAQVVAVIPRSWMNGLYFKPFRYWLLEHAALTHIHVFERRDQAFRDDEVLQENVIVKLVVGDVQGDVEITASADDTFFDLKRRTVPFAEVVTPGDEDRFVHVPTVGAADTSGLPGAPLRTIGLDVCTGPVVDFRLREHLHSDPKVGDAPLLYATHFAGGTLEWPKQSKKPNAIAINQATQRWLMPVGTYVVTRRFTSKEEPRRVVAFLLCGESLNNCPYIGFENHLNVFHCNKRGLDDDVARGLCAYLNSQAVDDYFRTFSGHTQVNATDLRRLCYPTLDQLKSLGKSGANEGSGGAPYFDRNRHAESAAK